MLVRFDPLRELAQLLNGRPNDSRPLCMPMDAFRDGDRFIVKFDIPGVDPSSIDLTLERNELTVRAERAWRPDEGQQVVARERPQGAFPRQLFLGDSLDAEAIQASYGHGVLTLEIPVTEQAKPRKVEVLSTEGSRESDDRAARTAMAGA